MQDTYGIYLSIFLDEKRNIQTTQLDIEIT